MKWLVLVKRYGKVVAILPGEFPYNAGWRLDYEREKSENLF